MRIFEALFILSLDDDEGDIIESIAGPMESVLARAVLAELVLLKRVELVENRIIVTGQAPTENSILDKTLFDMIDTSKPRKLKYWINTLTYKKILDDIGQHLVEKGVLSRKKKRLHLVIPYNANQHGNISAKYVIKSRLREIVLTDQQPDLSEQVTLAFLYQSDLLKLVFTLGEHRAAHKRVKKLLSNEEKGSQFWDILGEIT